jgi:peptidoglycan/LPS O-acetylase OafA/YrhL
MPVIMRKLYGQTLLPYLWMFVLPCFIAEYKEKKLPYLKKYWWLYIILTILIKYFVKMDIDASYGLVHTLLLFCSLTGMAYSFSVLNVKTDISYGIYIYHMTIVNALLALGYSQEKWLLLVVFIITCLIAWFSTVTIGKYSLSRKYK